MGVTYKITDEIVQFILQAKQENPKLSCRDITEQVAEKFQKAISKSSVHDVLKEAHLTHSRPRKDKFAIPQEKKAQLLANIPLAVIAPVPTASPIDPPAPKSPQAPLQMAQGADEPQEPDDQQVPEEQPSLRPDPVAVNEHHQAPSAPAAAPVEIKMPEILKPLEKEEAPVTAQTVLLEAAFAQFFPRGYLHIKHFQELGSIKEEELQQEMNYRSSYISYYRLGLEDGSHLYVDSLFQRVYTALPTDLAFPIGMELAINKAADRLINNMQPIIIKEFTEQHLGAAFFDLMACAQGSKGKSLVEVALMGPRDQEPFAAFQCPSAQQKQIIAGISLQTIDIIELRDSSAEHKQSVKSYLWERPLEFICQPILLGGHALRGFIVFKDDQPSVGLVSNCPLSVDDKTIVRMYGEQFMDRLAAQTADEMPPLLQAREGLKDYNQWFIGKALSADEFISLCQLNGTRSSNSSYNIINLVIPEGYEGLSNLIKIIQRINLLDLEDLQKRKIKILLG